jgi:hypothetical protein
MISNITKNRMGTVSFDAKFPGMRKVQDFIVYPIKEGDIPGRILVQSDTRIGYIYFASGNVAMSRSHRGGAYATHLWECTTLCQLSAEDLFNLKAHVFASAHGAAGKAENGIVQCDNSGALAVFG